MTRLRLLGAAALAAALGLSLGAARMTPWPAPLAAGFILTFSLTLPSYLALSWALHRTNAVFFGVFAGGLLVRMGVLLGAVAAVQRAGRWAVAPFVAAAAGGLLGFTVIELIFLNGQDQKWTSSTPSNTTSSTTSPSA